MAVLDQFEVLGTTYDLQDTAAQEDITNIKADLINLWQDAELLTPQISYKSNKAVTDNGDGTFTIGTTDFGNVFFDSPMSLTKGTYTLFGVPTGFSFINSSQSHTNPIVSNTTADAIEIEIETSGQYYIGYRNTQKPSTAFTITPSLIKLSNFVRLQNQVDEKADNEDISAIRSELFDDENELLVPSISSKTNNAVTDNGDGTFTIGTTDFGSVFFDSPLTLSVGEYTLFGVPKGSSFVSASTSFSGAIVVNESSDDLDFEIKTSGQYYVGYRNTQKPATEYVIVPSLKHTGTFTSVKRDIRYSEFVGQTDVITSFVSSTNNKVTNNNDGTFTIGTGNYGTVIFKELVLQPGIYKLFGVSNGYSFLSTNKVYTSAFVTNKSVDEKQIVISEKTLCYLGFRNDISPANAFVITPYLISDRSAELYSRVGILEGDINPYYTNELADTVAKVRDTNTSPALVFLWATDIHRHSSNADNVQTFDQMIANMRAVSKSIPCDFVLNTGDMTDGDVDKATTLSRAYSCLEGFKSIGLPYFWAQGNHDTNYASFVAEYLFSMDECYKAYYTANKGIVYNKNEYGTDYYIDYEWIGVRLIVLNANNCTSHNEYAFGDTTATWLETALNTNKKVLMAIHQSPIGTQITYGADTVHATDIRDKINTFINGGGKIITLTGHMHNDIAFISPWVNITQDCARFSNTPDNNYQDYGITGYIDYVKKNARIASTASQDLWTVVVYKPDTDEIDLIRFGAGSDRYFHVNPIAPTTVTTRLIGTVTWSSSDEDVASVSGGVITGIGSGKCAIIAKDESENYECWIVQVT